MFDRWVSEAILAILRLFVDIEWESLKLTLWSGKLSEGYVSEYRSPVAMPPACSLGFRATPARSPIALLPMQQDALIAATAHLYECPVRSVLLQYPTLRSADRASVWHMLRAHPHACDSLHFLAVHLDRRTSLAGRVHCGSWPSVTDPSWDPSCPSTVSLRRNQQDPTVCPCTGPHLHSAPILVITTSLSATVSQCDSHTNKPVQA